MSHISLAQQRCASKPGHAATPEFFARCARYRALAMSVPEDATDVLGRRIAAGLLDLLALVVLLIIVGVSFGQGHAGAGSVSVQRRGASVAVWALLALAYYYIPEALRRSLTRWQWTRHLRSQLECIAALTSLPR